MRKKYLLALMLLFSPLWAGWNSQELVRLYFHNSELQSQWAWGALSNFGLKGHEDILDFGSGDGKISAALSARVPNGSVTGVDISEDMVHFASKMFPYKNLSFVNVQDVNFADFISIQKYDLVTSFCVFHLVPNPSIVLDKIRSHIKPKGGLVLTLPLEGDSQFFSAVNEEMGLRGWEMNPPSSQIVRMSSEEGANQILEASGFNVLLSDVVDTNTIFGSKEELVDWCGGTLTVNLNIPEEGRREFFQDVVERYLSNAPENIDEEGFITFPFKRLDIVAVIKK